MADLLTIVFETGVDEYGDLIVTAPTCPVFVQQPLHARIDPKGHLYTVYVNVGILPDYGAWITLDMTVDGFDTPEAATEFAKTVVTAWANANAHRVGA